MLPKKPEHKVKSKNESKFTKSNLFLMKQSWKMKKEETGNKKKERN